MNPWIERWKNNHIGWHEAAGNHYLKTFWPSGQYRVLVPLCGKAVDLLWLEEQGNSVVGVELSPIAARAFFDEAGLAYEYIEHESGATFRATERRVTIEVADFFDYREGGFDAHFDRGALIAMPPDRRADYARHVSTLLQPGALQLVITLVYDQARVSGPPWSVPAKELLSYWPELREVASHDDLANGPPKFQGKGLSSMREIAWLTSR